MTKETVALHLMQGSYKAKPVSKNILATNTAEMQCCLFMLFNYKHAYWSLRLAL